MPIKNYTTDVPVDRTINEIHKILAKAKANAILTNYGSDGLPASLSFRILVDGASLQYLLPVEVDGVMRSMKTKNRDQARRVAWRIIKDWIDSQMALIEAQQAELAQVFLPYAQDGNGKTFYQHIKSNGFLQLSHKGAA